MTYWGFQCPSASKDLALLEQLSGGRHLSKAGFYMSSWASGKYVPFPKAEMDKISAYGAMPSLSWQLRDSSVDSKAQPDWSYASILSDKHNDYFTSFIKAWGLLTYPSEARIFHEMDGDWYPWGLLGGINGNTPDLHKQAWAKLTAMFRQYAPLVIPVWCPDSYNLTNNTLLDAALPDVKTIGKVSCDCYNFGSFGPHGWRSAATMFDRTVAWYKKVAPNTPFIISEVGCAEDPASGSKGDWIKDFAATISAYGNVKEIMWMHDTASGGRINRIDSSTDATRSWQTNVTAVYQPGYIKANNIYIPFVV